LGAFLNINLFFQAERDGSNEYSNYQPGSLNTTDTLVKDLDNIDIIFHIGDIVYANGYISQWDQFTAQVEPLTAKVPYMLARYCSFNFYIGIIVFHLIA
jgi:acid phosphatase type 7